MQHATRERPLDCSLELADVFAVKLCSLVVEGVFGVWFVEQVDKPVDDRIDIQHLYQRKVVIDQTSEPFIGGFNGKKRRNKLTITQYRPHEAKRAADEWEVVLHSKVQPEELYDTREARYY